MFYNLRIYGLSYVSLIEDKFISSLYIMYYIQYLCNICIFMYCTRMMYSITYTIYYVDYTIYYI